MKLPFLIFLLFLILINPVNANTEGNAVSDAGANMVNNGINAWLVSTAESIISFAEGKTNTTTTRSPGQMVLFRMIAYSYDPFENPGVIKTIQSTGIIFLFLLEL